MALLVRLCMVSMALQSLVLSGCGGKAESVTLVGQNLPKAQKDVAVGSQTRVGPFDSQTATYPGADMNAFNRHISQLEKAGWKLVSRTETVAGLAGVMALDKSRGTVSWSPSSGLIVNIQVPRAESTKPAGDGAAAKP